METFVTLVKMTSHPERDLSTIPEPTALIEQTVKSRGGSITCAAQVHGRYDLVVFSQFDNKTEYDKAWLPLVLQYGWQTETLDGTPFPQFKQIYIESQKLAAAQRR
jgi:uncharacterized protein with GYD domain